MTAAEEIDTLILEGILTELTELAGTLELVEIVHHGVPNMEFWRRRLPKIGLVVCTNQIRRAKATLLDRGHDQIRSACFSAWARKNNRIGFLGMNSIYKYQANLHPTRRIRCQPPNDKFTSLLAFRHLAAPLKLRILSGGTHHI